MNFNKLYSFFLIAGLATILFSCEEEIEIPGGNPQEYSNVYMAVAARNPNTTMLEMADSVQTLIYGANYAGVDYPKSDIDVQFEVNEAMVDSFNNANGTECTILPVTAYELEATSAVIPAGNVSTAPLSVSINPANGMELFKDYLLPISISGISSDYELGENLTTAYYVVQASLNFEDFTDFDRSNWSVLGVSTEEPAEGPDNRGVGEAVFDDNLGSFWHTKWSGGFGEPPHWIAIDMGTEQELHGIALYGRQSDNAGKPKNVIISVSTDGENWTDVANVELENTNDEQRFFVDSFLNARYFKMTVNSNFGDVEYTYLAEIYAF